MSTNYKGNMNDIVDITVRYFLNEKKKRMRKGYNWYNYCINDKCNVIRYTPFIVRNIGCLCYLIQNNNIREYVINMLEKEYDIRVRYYNKKEENYYIELTWDKPNYNNELFYKHEYEE